MSDRDRLRAELADQLTFFAEIGITHLDLRQSAIRPDAETERPTVPAEPPATATEPPLFVSTPSTSSIPPHHSDSSTSPEPAIPTLDAIREELGDCTRCKLHPLRTNLVFGVGDPHADLMFVGEAPGQDEDLQGIPFVGKAGQLLTRIITAIDLTRDQVYIANILKCRPPENRDPQPDEVASCEPFLFKQIESIRPMIIVALGRYAAQTLLRTATPISRLRGRFFDYRGSLLMPTFHPSYLLRYPSSKRDVWVDMQLVRDTLKERGSRYYR